MSVHSLLVFALGLCLTADGFAQETVPREVVVYGSTPAGVIAAIAAARQGHSVSLVHINAHIGGMVSGGLVATDMGDRQTVGGLADEFFQRIVKFYTVKYCADAKELTACRKGATFEPHVAELIFEQMLSEQPRITVWKRNRYRAVTIVSDRSQAGHRIVSLVVDDLETGVPRTFTGNIFSTPATRGI